MKFKVGQKVETFKGLVGVIREIDNDYAYVEYFNCEDELVDNEVDIEDLKPYSFKQETLKKVRKLEKHPLFEISEKQPIFVVNNKVYSLGESNRDFFIENVSKRKLKLDKLLSENSVSEERNKRGIVEISSISDLDELSLQRNEKSIQDIQQLYFKNTLGYLGLEGSAKDNSIQQLIFSQVFPYFRDSGKKKDKIAELLGDETKSTDKKIKLNKKTKINNSYLEQAADNIFNDVKEIEKAVRKDYEQEANLKNFISLSRDKNEDYERIIWDKDFALVDGKFYYLNAGSKDSDLILKLEGNNLSFRNAGNVKDAERVYQEALARKIRINTLKQKLTKENLLKLLKENKFNTINAVKNLEEYHEKNFGFFRGECEDCEKEGYHVYLEIPAFGIKSPFDDEYDDEYAPYYLFRKSKVAIHVSNDNDKIKYDPEVSVWEDKGSYGGYHLCLSGANIPTDGKDVGEIIAKRLRCVRNMILTGASEDWYIRGGYDDEGVYEGSSLAKLRKMKVKIRKSAVKE